MATDPKPDVNSRDRVGACRGRATLALAVILLAGCAHEARHFEPPSTAELHAKHAELKGHVAQARIAADHTRQLAAQAVQQQRTAVDSHAAEVALIGQLAPRVADLAMRVTAELRPEVEELAQKVDELSQQGDTTAAALAGLGVKLVETQAEAAAALAATEQATEAEKAIAEKLAPAYEAKVAQLAERANIAEQAWAKDSAEIVAMKSRSLLYKIAAGAGLVAILAVVILKLTGRLATRAAAIVA